MTLKRVTCSVSLPFLISWLRRTTAIPFPWESNVGDDMTVGEYAV